MTIYLFFIFLLFVVNLTLGGYIYFAYYRKTQFLNPVIFIYFFYFLNYPLRSIVLAIGQESYWVSNELLNHANILRASLYSTIFFLVFLVSFHWFKFKLCTKSHHRFHGVSYFVLALLVVPYVLTSIYKYYSGYGFSLGEDSIGQEVQRGNLLLSINYLLHEYRFLMIFSIALYLLSGVSFKDIPKFIVFGFASVIFLLFFGALVTTSKGDFVNFFFIFAILWNLSGKKVKNKIIFMVLPLGGMFVVYSTLMRYLQFATGEFSFLTFVSNIFDAFSAVMDSEIDISQAKHFGILERFNYLDALIKMMGSRFEKGDYVLGSVRDVLGLVPSAIWVDKPFFNFNVYISQAVWEFPVVMEIPFGRIGESFFILSYFGLAFGVIYGFILRMCYQLLFLNGDNLQKILYFSLLFSVIIPDAFMFYNYRSVIYVLFFYYFLRIGAGKK